MAAFTYVDAADKGCFRGDAKEDKTRSDYRRHTQETGRTEHADIIDSRQDHSVVKVVRRIEIEPGSVYTRVEIEIEIVCDAFASDILARTGCRSFTKH